MSHARIIELLEEINERLRGESPITSASPSQSPSDTEYATKLAEIADAYGAGEISRDEWRRQVAELRERRIGSREKERQGRG